MLGLDPFVTYVGTICFVVLMFGFLIVWESFDHPHDLPPSSLDL